MSKLFQQSIGITNGRTNEKHTVAGIGRYNNNDYDMAFEVELRVDNDRRVYDEMKKEVLLLSGYPKIPQSAINNSAERIYNIALGYTQFDFAKKIKLTSSEKKQVIELIKARLADSEIF